MDGILTFISIIFVVFGILQIILFFKIWGMTNDIKDIRNKYVSTDTLTPLYTIGSIVKHAKNDQCLIIKKFDTESNKYVCYSEDGLFIGSFRADELIKQ